MEDNYKIIRSFADSLKSLTAPLITLEFLVNGKPTSFNFLIDTGASDCYIDSNVVKLLDKVVNLEEDYCSVYSSTGTQENIGLSRLEFVCDGHSFSQRFLRNDLSECRKYIQENYKTDFVGMIGINFFRRYKAVINYADCTISFNTKYDTGNFT